MRDLTTAHRLATYQAELQAAGFTPREAWELVQMAAPSFVYEVQVAADSEDQVSAAVPSASANLADGDGYPIVIKHRCGSGGKPRDARYRTSVAIAEDLIADLQEAVRAAKGQANA